MPRCWRYSASPLIFFAAAARCRADDADTIFRYAAPRQLSMRHDGCRCLFAAAVTPLSVAVDATPLRERCHALIDVAMPRYAARCRCHFRLSFSLIDRR